MPLEPAILQFTEDGTPYSPAFEDIYHARGSALEQARAVFLSGNNLPERFNNLNHTHFAILETGFGLGMNFLATWLAWRAAEQTTQKRLHYVAIEQHPFHATDLAQVHASYPEVASLSAELVTHWPPLTPGSHRLVLNGGRVILTLFFGDARKLLPQLSGPFDAVYLDGFAPSKNPELWSPEFLSDLEWLTTANATAATYTVAGSVRRGLEAAGFVCEKQKGHTGKRERLSACKAAQETSCQPTQTKPPATAIVIGAGLAGCAIASKLAARGTQVTLLERRPAPAQETSGNLAAIALPVLSLDDNRLSRLNRAGYLAARAEFARLAAIGQPLKWSPCGVLHLGKNEEQTARQAEVVRRMAFPEQFVRYVETDEASQLAGGRTIAGPGWWFEGGTWVSPASLCSAWLSEAGDSITRRYNVSAEQLVKIPEGWQVQDAKGNVIAKAAVVVLATALDTVHFDQAATLPIRRFRGQTTLLDSEQLTTPLNVVICHDGYATPPLDGITSVGASFHRSDVVAPRPDDHAANLKRLTGMLPDLSLNILDDDIATLPGRVGFRPVSPDKLPMVGALPIIIEDAPPPSGLLSHLEWPRHTGLYCATGYGSRGLVWSVGMAELLACQIHNEPLPVEAELAAAVDPARFAFRGLR